MSRVLTNLTLWKKKEIASKGKKGEELKQKLQSFKGKREK